MANQSFYHIYPSTTLNNGRDQVNTLAHFSVKLPEKERLEGRWAVGLSSISFSLSWPTLEESSLGFLDAQGKSKTVADKIPSEFIFDVATLVKHVNDYAKKPFGTYKYVHPLIGLNAATQRVYIQPGLKHQHKDTTKPVPVADIVYPALDGHLLHMLGFPGGSLPFTTIVSSGSKQSVADYKIYAPERPDLSGGIRNIYLYCNLVRQTKLGDSYSTALRIVDVPPYRVGSTVIGETVCRNYDTPQFFPLETHEFDFVEFELRASDGRLIPFTTGETIITVQFKCLDGS